MGKPYKEELARLPETTVEAFSFDIAVLKRAVEDASGYGLIIVASGGSLTGAHYLADCHQRAVGHPCRAVSALVFQSDPSFARGHVWLLSAGGRNNDIMAAAEHAIASGARSVTALIAVKESPLERRLLKYGSSRSYSFSLAAGTDGFLATNTLWATCILVERAYQAAFPDRRPITEREVLATLHWARQAARDVPLRNEMLTGIADPPSLVGLADLEMRATEAALSNVWVTDLRNLAHGRHFWFASHQTNTQAIVLTTDAYRTLADQTAALVRSATTVHVVAVPDHAAGLASIAFSMHLAGHMADRLNRDPGRPGVPAFGEGLYNLRQTGIERVESPGVASHAIASKLVRAGGELTFDVPAEWLSHLEVFCARLGEAEIAAIVFDFDGTLVESTRRYEPLEPAIVVELVRLLQAGVEIAIATGRGDSCGSELRASLPKQLWSQVLVGYYNGACILPLEQEELPQMPQDPAIAKAIELLQRHFPVGGRARLRAYAKQCSVTLLDGSSLTEAWCRTSSLLHDLVVSEQVRVWMSSHSVDVVAHDVTKQDVVRRVAAKANCLPDQVLCIGDRGRWPGNDFELLEMPLSLSSDECSPRSDRCWNLAGVGVRQVAATCAQLQLFDVVQRRLVFRGVTE